MPVKLIKVLSLVVSVLLLFAFVVGCGGQKATPTGESDELEDTTQEPGETGEVAEEEEPEEPTYDFGGRVIKYSAWWDLAPVAGRSEGEDKMIERMAELEEKYNFKMEYLNIPWGQTLETFTASVLAGDPYADLAIVENTWFMPGLVSAGMCLPVDDIGVFDFEDPKWNQASLKAATWNGKIYGFKTGRQYPRGVMW